MSDLDDNVVQITQLRIENCTFQNITLLSFIQYQKSINFEHISISNSNFSQSTFLEFNLTNLLETKTKGNFISGIEIKNCLFNFTTFIKNIGNKEFRIADLKIYETLFYNSYFIDTDFKINLVNVEIEKNQFYFSTFFQSATYLDSVLLNDFLFQQIKIQFNIFKQSKLFHIYQQNENKILVYADSFIQDDQLYEQIEFNIENQSSLIHLYDFSCYLLSINNFTLLNTQNSSYFKIYQTDKIIFTNIIFSNQDQIYKISESSACNLAKKISPILLYVQGFSVINMKNISIFNQFSIDNSLFKIQSDLLLQSINAERITIEAITFRSNILLKYNLANVFSLIVIYSEKIQNIYIKDLTFQENFFHQIIDDPSQVGAGLIYLNSFQSSIIVDGLTCIKNSMTNSSYSFIALNSLTISFNKLQVTDHNFLSRDIWQKYYQIELDKEYSPQVIHSLIDQIFGIKTVGGILKILSSQLTIQNTYLNNILAKSSVAFTITTQGKGIIVISNVQILRAYVMLLQNNSIDGCITISSVTSLLNLQLQNINFDLVHNRFGSAILTIDPSLKQNSIILMNITINNSFSLLNQIVKIQFQLSSPKYNQVLIQDLQFFQSQNEFKQYLQSINFPSISEIRKIKSENSLINLSGCRLIINNFFATGILISPLLIVNDAEIIKIKNLKIQEVQVLYPFRLLQFTFTQTNAQHLILEKIFFHSTSQVFPSQNSIISEKVLFSIKAKECILSPEIIKIEHINQTINSFLENLDQVYVSYGSFIFLEGLTQFSKVKIWQIDIRNNNCSFCYDGLIQIKQQIPSLIIINDFLCSQNQIQKYGCFSLTTEEVPDQGQQFSIINNSRFVHNFGEMGVGIFISKTPFQIKNSFFLRNNGSETGGAIQVTKTMTNFTLNNSIIIENSANFGGGMYLEGPNYLSENNFIQSLILFNKAQILSNNLVEAPDHLILQINNEEMNSLIQNKNDVEQYTLSLKPYKLIEQGKIMMTNYLFLPSNQKILHYQRFNEKTKIMELYIQQFSLIYKNSLNEIEEGEEKDYCSLFSRNVQADFQDEIQNYSLIQNFSYQSEKINFNLNEITIKFDPYLNKDSIIQLLFKCETTSGQKILHYQINAKTFKCQLGEFYTDNGCQYCEPNYGFYSVEYDVVKCSIFDVNKLDNITSNQLQLKIGYWRPNYFSNEISLCFKGLEYCIGGWKVNNELCYKGHIGGLCEECDQFNVRGDGNYVKISNGACGNCSKDSTLLPFFFLFLWSFLSILFTLRSIRKTNKTFVILKSTTQLFQILFKLTQDFESIFLKMLLNYLWLFSVIFAFNISFNFSLSAVDSISSPNVTMATNLDCELLTFGTFQLIYLRLITIIVLLILQIIIILVGFIILCYLEKINFDYSVISNILIYLYVSNQAQLIKSFGSLIAIRTISGIDYIQGDVSLLFYEKDHITWVYAIILPSLIITGLFIPLFFFIILIFNQNKFTQTNFRKHLGYLFNEYNQEYSYWEQSKILQRSIIIIIITYFETDIYIKASFMSLTLLTYIIFAVNMRPYILKSLNKLDFESCCIIQISIFLAIVKYISSQQSNNLPQQTILQIIMLLLFSRICYCFVSRIIVLYYKKYQIQFFYYLKNLASQLFTNQIIVIYLNQKHARILLRKQKLNINYEKLREWKNQFKYSIPSRKQTTLTGFTHFSINQDKQKP